MESFPKTDRHDSTVWTCSSGHPCRQMPVAFSITKLQQNSCMSLHCVFLAKENPENINKQLQEACKRTQKHSITSKHFRVCKRRL